VTFGWNVAGGPTSFHVMSERPNDPGLTPGDPLAPEPEKERHESGLPAYEPEAPQPSTGGYTSPPPPGALATPTPSTPPVASGQYQLAGWWSRVAATLIDGLIVGVGALVIIALFGAVFSVGFFESEETGVVALVVGLMLSFLAVAIVALLYAPLMMDRTNGKTLGRMAMGIRVVRANGQPMTFGWAMLREVAVKALLFGFAGSLTFGLANLADVLWPLWDDENRALHDFIVDTRVVRD
jgi:uncharacterized RDD family membrane protein YckC